MNPYKIIILSRRNPDLIARPLARFGISLEKVTIVQDETHLEHLFSEGPEYVYIDTTEQWGFPHWTELSKRIVRKGASVTLFGTEYQIQDYAQDLLMQIEQESFVA
jgi:hypothetical protein